MGHGLHPRSRKKGLQANLEKEITQEIETLLGRTALADLDFEAIEMAARRQALRLAARALEQRLNADTSDHVGAELPCPCGATAQYHGRHAKTFESVLGFLQLERAYYHCGQCQSGFCPRDRDLGLESFSLTPGVLRMTASAAALLSFEESSGLLRELGGVKVSTKQVERAAEALGAEIAVDERQHVERRASWLLPCTWEWMAPGCPCALKKSPIARFHAKEHLSTVRKAIYGDSLEGKGWIDLRYDELDEGRLKSLVEALHVHAGQYKEARECIHYIWKNRRRMRYPEFHKQGFCTSTGVVEAGCKVAIGTRLKRAGMHWTLEGANAMIALRCGKLSGRFEDFWERRCDQKKRA